MNYGKYYRKLRVSRKKTLSQVCNGVLTESFVSKFERGVSDISIKNLEYLLKGIDMSLNDFFKSIDERNKNDFDKNRVIIMNAYINRDINKLESMLEEFTALNLKFNKDEYLLWIAMIEGRLQLLNIRSMDQCIINKIKEYFINIEIFDKYSLFFLNNLLPVLPFELIEPIIIGLIEKEVTLEDNVLNIKSKIGIILNYLHLLVEAVDVTVQFKCIKKMLEYLRLLPIPEMMVEEKIRYQIITIKYWLLLGKYNEAKGRYKKLLGVLKILDMQNLEETITNYFKQNFNV